MFCLVSMFRYLLRNGLAACGVCEAFDLAARQGHKKCTPRNTQLQRDATLLFRSLFAAPPKGPQTHLLTQAIAAQAQAQVARAGARAAPEAAKEAAKETGAVADDCLTNGVDEDGDVFYDALDDFPVAQSCAPDKALGWGGASHGAVTRAKSSGASHVRIGAAASKPKGSISVTEAQRNPLRPNAAAAAEESAVSARLAAAAAGFAGAVLAADDVASLVVPVSLYGRDATRDEVDPALYTELFPALQEKDKSRGARRAESHEWREGVMPGFKGAPREQHGATPAGFAKAASGGGGGGGGRGGGDCFGGKKKPVWGGAGVPKTAPAAPATMPASSPARPAGSGGKRKSKRAGANKALRASVFM